MNQQVFFCLLSICLISSSFTSSTPVPAPEKNIIPEEKFRTCTATEKAFVKESYSNAQQVENLDNQPCKNDSEDFDHQGRGKPVLWYSEDANSCLLMEKLCLREKLIVRTFKVMSDGEIMEKNGEGIRGVSRSLCGCRGGKCGCRGGSCGCAARDPKRREQLLAQLRAQLEQQVANRPAGGCPRCRGGCPRCRRSLCGCRGGKCGCRGGNCGCAARDPKRREQLLAQLRAQLEQQVANRPAGGCPRCRGGCPRCRRSLCGCRGGKCGCRGGNCGCAARDPKRREQLLAQLRAQLEQQVANRPAGGCPRCRRSLKQTEEKIDKHAWTPKDEVPKEIESKIDNHAWVPKDEKTSTANKSKIDSYAWTPTDEQSSPNASQQISELEQQIKSKISELADLKNGNQSTDGNHGY